MTGVWGSGVPGLFHLPYYHTLSPVVFGGIMSATMKWHVEVGLFARSQFRRFLQMQSFYKAGGIGVTWEESKGLIETDFFITAVGPSRDELLRWKGSIMRATGMVEG